MIKELMQIAADNQCSDIHLTEGLPPLCRKNGVLMRLEGETISREDILSILDDEKRAQLEAGADLDFSTDYGGGRQRINIFRQNGTLAAAIRLLNTRIPSMEELGLPPVLKRIAGEPRGLVLVTGPTGSGKTTTLAAMIDYINMTRGCHIITIEDPVEYVYKERGSLIHQREVGRDAPSFASALRSALREDPDVILVGEMRDFETISAAITAAETGHLVLSTLHTSGAANTVDRIVDVFPSHGQAQVRTQLAGVLKAVVTQELVPLAPALGAGRVPALEIMLATDAILNLIREGKAHQINTLIQSGAALGMQTLDGALAQLVRSETVALETAMKFSSNPRELKQLLL